VLTTKKDDATGITGLVTGKREMPDMRKLYPIFISGLLIILVLLFFWEMFFGGKVLCMRDMLFDFIPQHSFAGKVLQGGHLPFWNTYSGFGKPFLADPQTAAFYPPHIVFYLFSPVVALKFYCLIHLWITGVSMYALARHWRMDRAPALVSAISWMFGSWLMGSMEFANNFTSVTWMPIIILITAKITNTAFHPQSNIRTVQLLRLTALLALFLCMQYLTGYPEFVAYTCVICVAYILALCTYEKNLMAMTWAIFLFAGAGLLALLLASPQLFLGLEFLDHSERAVAVNPHFNEASLHPRHLLGFFLPFINGYPGYPDKYWAGTVYEFWLGTCYVGIVPLILACAAMLWLNIKQTDVGVRRYRFFSGFLCAVVLSGMIMAFGKHTPLYKILFDSVPGFNRFRFPSKFLLLVAFGISMLAGIGYQAIYAIREKQPKASSVRNILLLGGLGLWVLLLSGYIYAAHNPNVFKLLTNDQFPSSHLVYAAQLSDYRLALAFTLLGLLTAYGLARWETVWLDAMIVTIVFLNLFFVTRDIQPMLTADVLKPSSKSILKLMTEPNQYRVYSDYEEMQKYLYGVKDQKLLEWALTAGFGDSMLPWNLHYVWQGGQKLMRYKMLHLSLVITHTPAVEKLADLMSIRYIVSGAPLNRILWARAPRTLYVGERKTARPRVFLINRWIKMEGTNRILKTLLSDEFDPGIVAVVEPESNEATVPLPLHAPNHNKAGTGDTGKVTSLQDYPNRVDIQVSVTNRVLLVLNDAWYPGWKVLIDNAVQPLFRANFDFRGVFIEPGVHNVQFIYDPVLFYYGLWVSGATFIIIIMLLWGFAPKSRHGHDRAASIYSQ
jgi:hypothetical protein